MMASGFPCSTGVYMTFTMVAQIAVSRRAQPLTKAQIDQAIQPSRLETMAGNVSKWRTARGLQNASKSPRGSKHTCSGRTLFSRLGTNTFLCERCGWQHVCDNNCTERVVQRNYELPVCPISGRCFEQMLNEWVWPLLLFGGQSAALVLKPVHMLLADAQLTVTQGDGISPTPGRSLQDIVTSAQSARTK